MSIVSSIIAAEAIQIDGRIWVTEVHTDQVGLTYQIVYLAPNGVGLAAHLSASAANLSAQITAAEIANNIASVEMLGSLAVPTLVYSTVAANIAALRAAYAASTQTQAIMIGDYLSSLANAQLETAFGLTLAQTTTLRANYLTPAASAAATIRAAAGT